MDIVCLKSLPARFATENFGITRKTRTYLQTGQPGFPAARWHSVLLETEARVLTADESKS